MDLTQRIERRFRVRKQNGLPFDCPRGKREHLPQLFHEFGFTTGVEVGTRRGDYSKVLCENMPGLKLFCVDPWAEFEGNTAEVQEAYYQQAVATLNPFGVNFIRKPSLDAVRLFDDRSFDFVYVDGDHSFDACVRDIIEWSAKVKAGGIIAVHDYDSHQVGVVQAVDAYTRCHNISTWWKLREYPSTAFWINP